MELNPHNIDTVYILKNNRYIFVRKGYIIGGGPTELDFMYSMKFKNSKEIKNDENLLEQISYDVYINKYNKTSCDNCDIVYEKYYEHNRNCN